MEYIISLPLHNNLKNFITAAKQYLFNVNESSFNSVLYSLQILGQSSNQFIYDSKNTLMHEFYINLYELMNNINEESDIIWAAVNVLQSISKRGLFYKSKLRNYKFIFILAKLLKDDLSLDRKIKILKLLQEFTYQENLQWQENYLSELIILLVKWISSEDKDLISLSLGILVNLCYENKFAMFVLVKCTHSKQFMRLLLKLQSDDLFINVQVYKLLLVLEKVSGQVPNVDINNMIDVTFNVLEEGIKLKNTFILHHAIDFFIDISKHSRWANDILEYPNFNSKLINILEAVNNIKQIEKSHCNYEITLQSVGLVLQLIHHIIQLKDFFILYPQILSYIMEWFQFLELHEQLISLLYTIINILRIYNMNLDQNLQCNIHEKIEGSLDMLITFLLQPNKNIHNEFNINMWNKHAECLRVLQEVIKIQQFYEKVVDKFSISSLQSLFYSLMNQDINDLNNLQNITFVYVEALCFLSDLVAKNPMWMSLYSEVLNQKHVYNVLAYIIYNGSKKKKQRVLDLIAKFPQQSTLMLSDCLEELGQYFPSKIRNLTNANSIEITPLCSFSQEQQLQKFIDQLENMFNSNEVHNIQTSNIIKLYQYKITAMQQTEVWLKKSLDNASQEITKLNYNINCLNNESMQLNQMLLKNHQTINELTIENIEMKQKLNDVTVQFSTVNNNFAKLSRNYESKRLIIQEHESTIKNLKNQLEELQIEINNTKTNLLNELQNEKTENKIQVSKLEQQLKDKHCIINEKNEEINSKTCFIKNLENCILEKDKDIVDLRKQLQEEHRVREMISQMLAATSNKPQLSDN